MLDARVGCIQESAVFYWSPVWQKGGYDFIALHVSFARH